LLNARVSEHQLNDPDVHAIGEEPTCAFVPKVVPSQIDLSQLLLVLLDVKQIRSAKTPRRRA
jgi:hypothetical protein